MTVVQHIRRKRNNRPEQDFQRALVSLLNIAFPKTVQFFHVPNGGGRSRIEAGILHGQGVKAGVPDLIIVHNGKAFGLELKSEGGNLSDSQRTMFPKLREAGMRIEVARTMDEALSHILDMQIPMNISHEDKRRIVRAA